MKLLPLLIALVIPVFFVLLWAMSGYHRLAALRQRCRSAQAELEAQRRRHREPPQPSAGSAANAPEGAGRENLAGSEDGLETARRACEEAAAAYNAARDRFPVRVLAAVFGFSRADPFEETRE
jgi:hypothetical protein